MNPEDLLDDRQREVLRAIVQEYIATGGPVGSSQLARRPDFEVSSATMRNVMADLEELGFLEKPHTSAGRVPTDRGYRFYVDTFVRLREPPPRDRELIQQNLSQEAGVEEAVQEASRVLHFITRHAGVVVAPRPTAAVLERIEFVRLRENRVLAVLVRSRRARLAAVDHAEPIDLVPPAPPASPSPAPAPAPAPDPLPARPPVQEDNPFTRQLIEALEHMIELEERDAANPDAEQPRPETGTPAQDPDADPEATAAWRPPFAPAQDPAPDPDAGSGLDDDPEATAAWRPPFAPADPPGPQPADPPEPQEPEAGDEDPRPDSAP